MKDTDYIALTEHLKKCAVETRAGKNSLTFYCDKSSVSFYVAEENFEFEKYPDQPVIHLDQLIREPGKIASLVLSKLQLNKTVFARNCEVKKTDKKAAAAFLETYHIMHATQSAYNYGLYYKNELTALASFSKGRKMDRLHEDQRSFELIRFCCKSGITVTGGLTKLVKKFCDEKKAGDIMTYVDKQLSDGSSFIKAGFKRHGETEPNYFLVNRKSLKRTSATKEEKFDTEKFYLSKNAGNIKLVFTPLFNSAQNG